MTDLDFDPVELSPDQETCQRSPEVAGSVCSRCGVVHAHYWPEGNHAACPKHSAMGYETCACPERLTITVEQFDEGWRAWWGDGDRVDGFGLAAIEFDVAPGKIPWHVVWRLVNDTRVAMIERKDLTLDDVRGCHTAGVESGGKR